MQALQKGLQLPQETQKAALRHRKGKEISQIKANILWQFLALKRGLSLRYQKNEKNENHKIQQYLHYENKLWAVHCKDLHKTKQLPWASQLQETLRGAAVSRQALNYERLSAYPGM